MRAHALLGRGHQMDREQPLVQRDVRPLHHRAGAAGELVAAVVAKEITSLRLAGHPVNVERPAMRAVDAIGPARSFDMLAGGVFVVKAGFGKAGHGIAPMTLTYAAFLAKSSA